MFYITYDVRRHSTRPSRTILVRAMVILDIAIKMGYLSAAFQQKVLLQHIMKRRL